MDLIDTHCHLDDASFDADRAGVLARCGQAGVRRIVVPGVTATGWDNLLRLCGEQEGLYPALGLHPMYLEQHRPGDVRQLAEQIEQHHPLAIGEIGLDYYIENPDQAQQESLLYEQLEIARQAQLPVLLHCRKAHDRILKALREVPVPGGIAHAFNGSLQQAHQYIELGFKLGFGGMLTYERSSKLRKLARELPLEAIVLETDAPDMTVASHRGERNSPEYLPECLAALAEVRNGEPDELACQTTRNAETVLGLG
ncbi:MAG: TatD family hydrolase [Thiohalophilus sp.]|uniref:TatD family hydrolase n=1 Tax=Thiohalophilus sp. TaxID=3028392 RepID=UPI00286FDF2A|nr:TatD family hydrolase [Thiohalophilus sp.]MDR9435531.1 TatD family hydrolase [Thiohalophilus sp.]